MGLSFSCPFGNYSNLEDKLESIVVRPISLGDDEVRTVKRTLSFNGRDSEEPKILKSVGSGKMIVEGSVSFKQTTVSISAPCVRKEDVNQVKVKAKEEEDFPLGISESCNSADMEESGELSRSSSSAFADSGSPKHEAATKLQKVYKSFRTRRKLADCAVLIEQNWWELLDFAQLKHSSISFFDIETSETAISRWFRAKTRAAKLGKGLSKNEKARKLALQHWLEAIDPRHRYGHNLHFYYVKWLQSQCREPFFYWLDIGEGREVNQEKCTRAKLQQQCIKYLGPMERLAYEVRVESGKLLYEQSGELLDTGKDPNTKWIFVLSTSKALYVGKKKKGTFQHSSFLAGGATSAAGRLVVDNGALKAVWPHSGHYKPTPENFEEFILFLRENNVDLVDVNMDPVEDEISIQKQTSSQHLRNHSSSEDLSHGLPEDKVLSTALLEEEADISKQQPKCRLIRGFSITRKVTDLLIPSQAESYMKLQSENASPRPCRSQVRREGEEEPTWGGYDEAEAANNDYEIIPEESILKRINSHKETKSYQLGKQLSGKWSTGAGPRISCVRDYPSKLQSRALEQVSLSPRTARGSCHLKSAFSARFSQKTLTVNHVIDNANVPARTKSAPPH